MSYEDLKQNTIYRLVSLGFTQDNDVMSHISIRQHQMIINGQPSIQEEKIETKITIIGEGSIDDQSMLGFNVKVNNNDAGDFWISSIEDLEAFLKV